MEDIEVEIEINYVDADGEKTFIRTYEDITKAKRDVFLLNEARYTLEGEAPYKIDIVHVKENSNGEEIKTPIIENMFTEAIKIWNIKKH